LSNKLGRLNRTEENSSKIIAAPANLALQTQRR
jgi:hypothetical protein